MTHIERTFGENRIWRKSRYSDQGACAYVAHEATADGIISGIRDGKLNNAGNALWVTSEDFNAVLRHLR